jgi:lipopolysaccharide transport system ATP-binding protein
MYVRLAFAVAAHLEPEVLLVDEVLAVGDALFQRKCIGKMGDVARAGRTVVFVSHNMSAVGQLCRRAIWLDEGSQRASGDVAGIIEQYLSTSAGTAGERRWNDERPRRDDDVFMLKEARLKTEDGEILSTFERQRSIFVEVEYVLFQDLRRFNVCIRLAAVDGTIVLQSCDGDRTSNEARARGRHVSRCKIPGELLNEGQYFVSITADIPFERVLLFEQNALVLQVVEMRNKGARPGERWPGVVRPEFQWQVESVDA